MAEAFRDFHSSSGSGGLWNPTVPYQFT
uniref:Uncharacterized protein n=1 Tax=Anguilla anguilla TaxID=7936 RepID=A0A0E9VWR3_ANGAN